jgi:hypothetical protein
MESYQKMEFGRGVMFCSMAKIFLHLPLKSSLEPDEEKRKKENSPEVEAEKIGILGVLGVLANLCVLSSRV